MSGSPGDALRLARRARRVLETRRLLRAGARGLIAAAAAGLPLLVSSRLLPGAAWIPVAAWALLPAGAVVGVAVASVAGRAVALDAAALWLDRALGSRERIVTLVTRPGHARAGRIAAGLDPALRVPPVPLPRELALVPAALFLMVAAALLPARGSGSTARTVADGAPPARASTAAPAAAPAERAPEEEARLLAAGRAAVEGGEPLGPEEADRIADLLDRHLLRPEPRERARRTLADARAGDAAARRELAALLDPAAGPGGSGDAAAPDEPAAGTAPEGGPSGPARGRAPLAYPEMAGMLRAYRRALDEE